MKLKDLLQKSQDGIAAHTDILKSLIEGQDEKLKKEHCKGMEGLVTEALKHTVEEAPKVRPGARCRDHRPVSAHDPLRHHRVRHRCGVRQGAEAGR